MAEYSNYRSYTDGVGFTIDSATQREKARRAAAILAEQTDRRNAWLKANPAIRHQLSYEQAQEDQLPAPILDFANDPVAFPNGRAPSFAGDRRAARFRDTDLYGPPPPLPPRPRPQSAAVAQAGPLSPPLPGQPPDNSPVRPWAPPRLVPQQEFDARRERRTAYPARRERPHGFAGSSLVPAAPPVLLAPLAPPCIPEDIMLAPVVPVPEAAQASLTPSQKKRLRKKRARQGGSPPTLPLLPSSSSPLLPSSSKAEGDLRVNPTPGWYPPQTQAPPRICPAEEIVQVGRVQFRVKCELHPWPHDNQPHMMRAVCASDPSTTVFIGWWTQAPTVRQ